MEEISGSSVHIYHVYWTYNTLRLFSSLFFFLSVLLMVLPTELKLFSLFVGVVFALDDFPFFDFLPDGVDPTAPPTEVRLLA